MAVRGGAVALYCQPGTQELPGVHLTGTIEPAIACPVGTPVPDFYPPSRAFKGKESFTHATILGGWYAPTSVHNTEEQ